MAKKVMLVFGTRPEAIKMCPLVNELQKHMKEFETIVCVTGQHREMLDQVLKLFEVTPDYDLNIMKQGQDLTDVTARVLTGMRDVFKECRPDVVLVHGDTTTSTAAALAAFYAQIPVGHVEAGLRTHNIYSPWPEEMNRQITGRIATYNFSPTSVSEINLLAEKVLGQIFVTGNTVIDALHMVVSKLKNDKVLAKEQDNVLAHCVDSFYMDKPLGGIGHLGAFSFHETKNISSGEGGMLVVNDDRFIRRAEILWEKGTNRAEFYRGMVNKYGWVDMGSSFLPSEFNAAFLWAQLEQLDDIQDKRKHIWEMYYNGLNGKVGDMVRLPFIPEYATNNGHMFYLLCPSLEYRIALMTYLKENDVQTTFHYLPLHSSKYYADKYYGAELPNCDYYSDCLVRLPLYYELTDLEVKKIIKHIIEFCSKN